MAKIPWAATSFSNALERARASATVPRRLSCRSVCDSSTRSLPFSLTSFGGSSSRATNSVGTPKAFSSSVG